MRSLLMLSKNPLNWVDCFCEIFLTTLFVLEVKERSNQFTLTRRREQWQKGQCCRKQPKVTKLDFFVENININQRHGSGTDNFFGLFQVKVFLSLEIVRGLLTYSITETWQPLLLLIRRKSWFVTKNIWRFDKWTTYIFRFY